MANWQERMEQAFLIRQTVERQRQKAKDEHRKILEVEERERELNRQQRLEKAETIIRNIGAYTVLERAKEVWKTGRVFKEIDEDRQQVRAILEVQYDGYFSEGGGSDYSYAPQVIKGKWRDRLIIEVGYLFDDIEHILVEDIHEFKSPGGWFNSDNDTTGDVHVQEVVRADFNNYTKTRGEVEEIILKFCESRIVSKTLPLDYKSRWAR